MTTETEAPKKTRGGARGPRSFKESPTVRDRVIGESIAKKAKELTGRDIDLIDVLAVKFTISRWYEDPATKDLMNDMDAQLKRAKAQEKREKAQKMLEEAELELDNITDDDADDESDDADDDETAAAAAAGDDDSEDEEDEDDYFDESDSKVSASF